MFDTKSKQSGGSPEFIRLPSGKNVCPHTGLRRGVMSMLCVPSEANKFRPAVPAKCLRQPGNIRGIWLIPLRKLIDHLNGLDSGPNYKQEDSK